MARHDFGFAKGQVFLAIIRLTYGWHKKEDKISISQICKITKLSKRSVIYALQNLEAQNKIIIARSINNNEKQINKISIQKDYSKWNDNSFAPPYAKLKNKAKQRSAKLRQVVQNTTPPLVQNSVKKVKSFAHTKDNITKDNNTKDIVSKDTRTKSPNPDLQEIIDFAKKQNFSLQGSERQNRRYAYNLMRKKTDSGETVGKGRVIWLIKAAISCRGKPYAPIVNDFQSLFYKWQDLLSFVQKGKNGKRGYEI